ncbi:MarC family protein [Paraburkholderia sacchari]|uniref:MarC family protein n=1 Tax=Paraburkholderia sacchari TaxID=159450 RepID=UPI0005429559|nr:MarC family protein [Paraburkholderia sacchari]NLP65031.1 antibiotic resistance protein MarC [Paraburkholderia sacchari]
MLNQFTETILYLVAGLFPIINPPAAGFFILGLVPHASPAERAWLAKSISLNSLIVLILALSIGAYVLQFFGISLPVLRVAGGAVIAFAGWGLLHTRADAEREAEQQAATDSVQEALLRAKAFYPLTLPITVGPGSIAVAIALGTARPRTGVPLVNLAGAAVGMLILWCSIYVCVRFAANVERFLGPVGTDVARRLFAFVLFCIGVQVLWLGLDDLLESVPLWVRFK